jgi:hypothetical protein
MLLDSPVLQYAPDPGAFPQSAPWWAETLR